MPPPLLLLRDISLTFGVTPTRRRRGALTNFHLYPSRLDFTDRHISGFEALIPSVRRTPGSAYWWPFPA
jgi:hypothetical protein